MAAVVTAALLAAGAGLAATGHLPPTAAPVPDSAKLVAPPSPAAVEAAVPCPTDEEITAELRQRNPSFRGGVQMTVEGGRCVGRGF